MVLSQFEGAASWDDFFSVLERLGGGEAGDGPSTDDMVNMIKGMIDQEFPAGSVFDLEAVIRFFISKFSADADPAEAEAEL